MPTFTFDSILQFLAALGLGAVLPAIMKLRGAKRTEDRAVLSELIKALQEDNEVLRTELRRCTRIANRANRRVDHFLLAVRGCPYAPTCPALLLGEDDFYEEDAIAAADHH